MKKNNLLKVLSATAIFSAIAAIEAYEQDNFIFASDEAPISSTTVAPSNTNVKPTENVATIKQDVKKLKDGEYSITAEALNFNEEGKPSMASAGLDKDKTKLVVKNGNYSVNVTFKPIAIGQQSGYLGDLKYYDGDKTHETRTQIKDTEFKDATILEKYTEKDAFFEQYKKKYPNRDAYPKTVSYSIDKNKIGNDNKLETYTQVFVPVMDSFGAGTQKLILKYDFSMLATTKVTADNYVSSTFDNPNKDREYDESKLSKALPINVQAHFRNANNNDETSLYEGALDNNVKVEKVGDKYHYTFRVKPGIADVGGEIYGFELSRVAYNNKNLEFKTLSEKQKIREATIITDKLYDKLQLTGTAKYPDGRDMSHFVTMQLHYETARPWVDRPIVETEEVAKPTPSPKPVTPSKPEKETPSPKPAAEDRVVEENKIPNDFPVTIKGELNGRTTNASSIYENAFVKDVKVAKVGDKYEYTIQVKEGKSNTLLLRNKPFTISKLVYKGSNIELKEIDSSTKLHEGKIVTEQLLDRIQLDATIKVQVKSGAKPRFEDRAAESTLALDFPIVEKKEVKEESANNLVPTTLLDAQLEKPSMGNPALLSERTRVEKVGDTYYYYVTFKDLSFGPLTGSVSRLNINGSDAKLTDLGTSTNEKLYHFTSKEKLTVVPVKVDVSVGGKAFHKDTAARLSFDWNKATALTTEKRDELVAEEVKKAEAEIARVAAEKAAAEKAAAEKAAAEKAAAEKAAAEKAAAEKAAAEKAAAEKAAAEKATKLSKEELAETKEAAITDIKTDDSLSKEEQDKLIKIVNNASLKDTFTASVEGEKLTVALDNTDTKATNLVVERLKGEEAKKVEEVVAKELSENLMVLKTLDLSLVDENSNIITKQGETRSVTIALVTNENEKLEVYYINGDKLEKVPSVYKDGKLTFFTNHFGKYTIVSTTLGINNPGQLGQQGQSGQSGQSRQSEEVHQNSTNSVRNTNKKSLPNTSTTSATALGLGVLALLSASLLRRRIK